MTVELAQHALIQRYGSLLKHVDRVPRSVTEIYRRWSGYDKRSFTHRARNERRWCAKALVHMTREGMVHRGVLTESDRTWVAFWREPVAPNPSSDNERQAM